MKIYKIDLDYIDNDGDERKKKFELTFMSQGLVNEIASLMGDIAKLQELGKLIENSDTIKEEIKKEKDVKERIIKLDNLRINLKAAKEEYSRLCTDELYKRKIDLIIKALKKNKIKDSEVLNESFWINNVDAVEMQAFLMSLMYRGEYKKKV